MLTVQKSGRRAVLGRPQGWGRYLCYPADERANDLRDASARGVQHAVGVELEQEHAGQVED